MLVPVLTAIGEMGIHYEDLYPLVKPLHTVGPHFNPLDRLWFNAARYSIRITRIDIVTLSIIKVNKTRSSTAKPALIHPSSQLSLILLLP